MKKAYARLSQDGTLVVYDSYSEARQKSGVRGHAILESCNEYRLDRLGRLWFDHVPTEQEQDYAMRHMSELTEDWTPRRFTPPTPVVVVKPDGECVEYRSQTKAGAALGYSFAFVGKLAQRGRVRDGMLIITKEGYDSVIETEGQEGIARMMADPERISKRLEEGAPVTAVGRDGTREDYPTRLIAAKKSGARTGSRIFYYIKRKRVRHDRMWMSPEEADALTAQGVDAVAAEYDRRMEVQPNGRQAID